MTTTPDTRPIVAGIINTLTGEITDTITSPSGKTALFLKARDELNKGIGKYEYMVFEFNSLGNGNIDFVVRNALNQDPSLIIPLRIMQTEYRIYDYLQQRKDAQKALETTEAVYKKCQALCRDSTHEVDIINTAFDSELTQCKDVLSNINSRISLHKKRLEVFKSEAQANSNPAVAVNTK